MKSSADNDRKNHPLQTRTRIMVVEMIMMIMIIMMEMMMMMTIGMMMMNGGFSLLHHLFNSISMAKNA